MTIQCSENRLLRNAGEIEIKGAEKVANSHIRIDHTLTI